MTIDMTYARAVEIRRLGLDGQTVGSAWASGWLDTMMDAMEIESIAQLRHRTLLRYARKQWKFQSKKRRRTS